MDIALRSGTGGLHHAVSLGNIQVSTKPTYSSQTDRHYDSEDEQPSRRRLRQTLSTELYPRTSVYSRGDIREQYCLTDRQLHSIERQRPRERFFGCLSRRSGSVQQAFLGGCVGRRVPSDENLAAYAPYEKYPRYHNNYGDKSLARELDSSYYRLRQPASILSTGSNKMNEPDLSGRYTWVGNQVAATTVNNNRDVGTLTSDQRPTCCTAPIESFYQDVLLRNYCIELYTQKHSNQIANINVCTYHYPTYVGAPTTAAATAIPPQQGPATNPRTKHVSFARSHTLTSFDNVNNVGLRSSERLKTARSQERLIGGKKPIIATGSLYEQLPMQPHSHSQPQQQQQNVALTNAVIATTPAALHQSCIHAAQAHAHQHTHQHQQYHAPIHIHQPMPDNFIGLGLPTLAVIPQPIPMPPLSPEVVVVEKKFRHAMKTQATQTDVRKDAFANILSLSPRATHRVKVVSQGAQTNGLQNGKKLTKSLSEIPNGQDLNRMGLQQMSAYTSGAPFQHDVIYRTQSQDPTQHGMSLQTDGQNNITMYYKPPPPLDVHYPSRDQAAFARERGRTMQTRADKTVEYVNMSALNETSFDYESNSLPRRTCTSHARTETDYYSNSLPRHPESLHTHDVCKHITECAELMGDSMPLDFTRPHLLPPPSEYRMKTDEDDGADVNVVDVDDVDYEEDEEEEPAHETESYSSEVPCGVDTHRRMSMMSFMPNVEHDTPFRRDDIRRQSMPVYGQTEKLIDGFGPRTSFRKRDKVSKFDVEQQDEKEIFIDFKPHISPKPSPKLQHRQKKAQKAAAELSQQLRQQQQQWLTKLVKPKPPAKKAIDAVERTPAGVEAAATYSYNDEEDVYQDDDVDVDVDVDADVDVDDDMHSEKDYPVYENISHCLCKLAAEHHQQLQQQQQKKLQQQQATASVDVNVGTDKREQFRKRSVSLDDDYVDPQKKSASRMPSTPASPCKEELLANVSTYPSSDSLANDNTRDHSDGIWNESQATVLTAEQKDISDGSFSSNLLLTPSSKRKNLLLQHQQRSSIDTDALDLEEQSPTYSVQTLPKIMKTPTTPVDRAQKSATLPVPSLTVIAPSIAVTPSATTQPITSPPTVRQIRTSKPVDQPGLAILQKHRHSDTSSHNIFTTTENAKSADISECSTNTDEYATCTDTSKRTPGIKTPPTTTSSSSTTQVPVSTQSSQLEKTQAGSSFESASSLYSVRGDGLSEELLQHDDKLLRQRRESYTHLKSPMGSLAELTRKSPSHSISSTSSGSYNMIGKTIKTHTRDSEPKTTTSANHKQVSTTIAVSTESPAVTEKSKMKPESISEDERSEVRYSSSGYYESPHDEDNITITKQTRTKRTDDERKRRKTTMKLDIEKENLRALTSPVKKPQQQAGQTQTTSITTMTASTKLKERSPEQLPTSVVLPAAESTSPSKMKRFRPKIRRQLRKGSREESTPRTRQKASVSTPHYSTSGVGDSEKLLDASMLVKSPTTETVKEIQTKTMPVAVTVQQKPSCIKVTTPAHSPTPNKHMLTQPASKSVSETCQLKAKSIESLRSVSPGSDSVFYSEADGHLSGHCFHCGKEMEGKQTGVGEAGADSVESLPYIEHEADIVKPPSDFADSPVTTKTTQRLYKKMDKRFRSEERYHHGERGRHYKSRQENIRAKSEERGREHSIQSPRLLRPAGSSPCVLPDTSTEPSQHVIYRGHYDAGRYTRLTDEDVWTQLDHQSFDRCRDRRASTESEKSFHAKYQVILHRLVQRRCTLEMYHRQKNNTFQLITSNSAPESVRRKLEEILKLMLLVWAREGYVISRLSNGTQGVDKTVIVKSDSGEFGFRIHGSKPVVVAAIEPDTPAESSGLEVGDIIISVNGVQVLDKHHTEVVKIAHDGCERLELQVARTIGVLMHEQLEPPAQPIFSGYLWRQSGQAKGAPNTKKWVRRWFSLRPDNCLYYYKTEDDTQPVGAMIMAKHVVEFCPPEIGKPFAFKVDSGEGIPMYVAADTDELANKWVNLLKQAAKQDNQWLDKSAHYLYQSPNSIQRPDCFGYLMKLGSRWCGWSKRYCVLKDACLYFYQDANSKSAFGMACLHGYKVASMSANASGKKNSFEIIPPEMKLRHYYFCTETEMDKKRWISALEYSIDRWIKSG